MVVDSCKFNPLEDIQEVDQFGYIDLVKSFQQGFVSGNSDPDLSAYNNIDAPESIIGKPSDAFEAMRMQDLIVTAAKQKAAVAKQNAAAKQSSVKDEV